MPTPGGRKATIRGLGWRCVSSDGAHPVHDSLTYRHSGKLPSCPMVQQYTGTTSHQIPFFSILSAPIPIPHPRTSRRAPWLWCPSRPSPARHRRTSAASFLRLRSPLGSSSKHRSLAYRGTRESAALTSGSSGPSPGSSASSSGSTLRLQIFAGPTFASGPISSVTGRAIRRWKFFMAAAPRDRRRRGRAPGAASSAAAAEDDGEEHHLNPFLSDEAPSSSRVQFRNVASRARWVEEAGEAEVVDSKGKLWLTTGVTRGGKLYYNVEEIGFLAERGALVLLDDEGGTIGMEEIYRKIAGGNYGCSWDAFQAYRHLKLLGYIVGRYGVPWTMKHSHTCEVTDSPKYMADADRCSDRADGACNDITKLLREMRIDGIYPSFQVHLPNSKFKKSSPGDPSFLLCLLRDKPPSRDELETVESKFHGIPLKFCHVDNGRVSFLSFDNVVLPSLP